MDESSCIMDGLDESSFAVSSLEGGGAGADDDRSAGAAEVASAVIANEPNVILAAAAAPAARLTGCRAWSGIDSSEAAAGSSDPRVVVRGFEPMVLTLGGETLARLLLISSGFAFLRVPSSIRHRSRI
jgi:hypothetical protein